jgi:hypothetical protein
MTYGVYSKDLSAYSLTGVTLETARRYLWRPDDVICSEKEVCNGFEITVLWHKTWRWNCWWGHLEIGPLAIIWRRHTYTTADKIVERFKEKKEDVQR